MKVSEMISALLPPNTRLSERQRDVLYLICKGLRNSEVAKRLGIGERTAKGYVTQLLLIFGATNRTELVGMIAQTGIDDIGSRLNTSKEPSGDASPNFDSQTSGTNKRK
jgi:DNA-binding CsgD family transcriptional regulator